MATKVKPTRLNVTWTPQVWQAPLYVDSNTMQWWDVGSSWYGRFLSLWNASTWQPISFPEATPYTYITWDYFMVETVSTATPPVNYRPDGASYTWTASTVVETDELEVWDVYVYDGTVWLLQSNHGKTVTFANIAWQPTDNLNLAADLNAKQDTLTAWTWIDLTSNVVSTASIYWVSTTAAATVQKEVSIPSITTLNVWQMIIVKPTVTSTVANSTLKLNNFPAYDMLYNAASITTSTDSIVWGANIPSIFILDEVSWTKYWRFVAHWLDSNTTYTINYYFDAWKYKAWTGTYAISRYSLCMMKPNMTWEKITSTSANYSTWTSKSVNTSWFVLNQIRYYNTTTAVGANTSVGTNTFQNQAASVNAAYSFNCGTAPVGRSTWTYIYLVWTIWADWLFYLDTTTRWSHTLPSTNDGKLYIRLWVALTDTDATISFLADRPIFYYDNWIKVYGQADNKQDNLSAWSWISISSNTVSNTWVLSVNTNTWAVTVSEFNPTSSWTTWDVLTKTAWGYDWATAPVTSVNSNTWAVTLDADDISDSTTTNKWTNATEKSTRNWKQNEHTATTATLSSASWTSHTQTVSVTWVTATNTVLVSPAPGSFAAYTNAVIYCSAQASWTLTFNCTTDPTSNITVNIIILD